MYSQEKIAFVILAGGNGTRMKSHLPKMMQKIAGKPMFTHLLDNLEQNFLAKKENIFTVINPNNTIATDYFSNRTTWVYQKKQLGTADALKCSLPLLINFNITLVFYVDVPLVSSTSIKALIVAVKGQESNNTLCLLTAVFPNPTGYGRIVRDNQNNILSIVEEKETSVTENKIKEINTGIMAINTQKLQKYLPKIKNKNQSQEFYLTDIIDLFISKKEKVTTYSVIDIMEIQGANDKQQLHDLERWVQKKYANYFLKQGVTIYDINRFDLRGDLSCEQDVEIDINCLFLGTNKLSTGVKIGANCVIKNSTIGINTIIYPFSHLENAIIGKNCTVGPFARLRLGANLADDVKIGNFVEVKKSTLASKVKAGHLSYLGDCTIEENTNIGAGVVVCNYDGKNKHKTTLGKNVFVGSNSSLVAPINIVQDVTIGAGSVVTNSVTSVGSLVIARNRQITIKNWEKK